MSASPSNRRAAAALVLALCGMNGCWSNSQTEIDRSQDPSPVPLTGTRIDLTGQTGCDAKLAQMNDQLQEAGSLVLVRTDVTGAGLNHLNAATRLKTLDLRHTSITDADLQNLHGMEQLETLVLDGSRVTAAGIAEMHRLLPHTVITPTFRQGNYHSHDNHH